MNINAVSSIISQNQTNFSMPMGKPRGGPADPSQIPDAMAKDVIGRNDANGDGSLSSDEISGLSTDDFAKLDASGDGTLGQDEIKTAVQTQMNALKQEFDANGPEGVQKKLESMKDTPEGKLIQALIPQGPNGAGTSGSSKVTAYQQSSDALLASQYSGSQQGSLFGLNVTA
jgi:hypothetical protein